MSATDLLREQSPLMAHTVPSLGAFAPAVWGTAADWGSRPWLRCAPRKRGPETLSPLMFKTQETPVLLPVLMAATLAGPQPLLLQQWLPSSTQLILLRPRQSLQVPHS